MDGDHAERTALRPTALAHARAVGRDLRAAEQRLAGDVGGDVVVAGGEGARLVEPGLAGDVVPTHRIAVGPPVGEHGAVERAQPQIEVDRVGAEDDAQPLGRVGHALIGRIGGAIDHGGVGRPPAHVAGPLIEVAVDQLDGVERKVDQPLALRLLGHLLDRRSAAR